MSSVGREGDMKRKAQVVVCFGDSLTWGWWQRGYEQTPYSEVLNESFAKEGLDLQARQFGIAGETTLKMVGRLSGVLQEVQGGKKVKKIWYPDMEDADVHSVIIFGGTNDLADANLRKDSMQNLCDLCERAAQVTERIGLCTLLPFNYSGKGEILRMYSGVKSAQMHLSSSQELRSTERRIGN